MQVTRGRSFIGRFSKDADLLASLEQLCVTHEIKMAFFSVIGAVECARLGYYNQNTRKYIESLRLDNKLEIVSCLGNVSLKDEKPHVHAHMVLANDQGQCFGGHVIPETVLFAAEYYIQELSGDSLMRTYDDQTGLFLWPQDQQSSS